MENQNILKLINSYLQTAEKAIIIFKKDKGFKPTVRAWQKKKIEQRGYLDTEKKYDYHFHGFGIQMTVDGVKVGWDFPNGNSSDIGFNSWFLWNFAQNFPREYLNFKKSRFDEDIKEALIELEKKGIIKKYPLPAANLYRLDKDKTGKTKGSGAIKLLN